MIYLVPIKWLWMLSVAAVVSLGIDLVPIR